MMPREEEVTAEPIVSAAGGGTEMSAFEVSNSVSIFNIEIACGIHFEQKCREGSTNRDSIIGKGK